MTLDDLKSVVLSVAEFDWCGRKIHLRKLGAKDHIALFSAVKSDADKELNPGQDHEATLRHHVEMAARSLASPGGQLIADSDEGRKWLEQVAFDDLVRLGELVLAHAGYSSDPQKKS